MLTHGDRFNDYFQICKNFVIKRKKFNFFLRNYILLRYFVEVAISVKSRLLSSVKTHVLIAIYINDILVFRRPDISNKQLNSFFDWFLEISQVLRFNFKICNQSFIKSAPLHLYSSCGLIIYPLGLCLNGRPNGWMTHESVCVKERERVCVIGRSNTWAQCVCTIHIAISLYLFLRTERVCKPDQGYLTDVP